MTAALHLLSPRPHAVVDLSHWQGTIDWPALAAAGIAIAIIKCTDHNGVDAMFDTNWRGAADAKIPAIAYPYLEPDDTEAEARHFCSLVGQTGIPAALDWERQGVSAQVMETFGTVVAQELGRDPLAYYGAYPPGSPTAAIRRWPRWFPEYASAPRLPPWNGKMPVDWSLCWLLWQDTQNGAEPGVSGHIDLSRSAVSVDRLLAWYRTGSLLVPARSATASNSLTNSGEKINTVENVSASVPAQGSAPARAKPAEMDDDGASDADGSAASDTAEDLNSAELAGL